MNVLYFTTYLEPADFQTLVAKASRKPNPAGQNFHGRLLAALSSRVSVHVFSLIPNDENLLEEKSFTAPNRLPFTYFQNRSRRVAKLRLSKKIASALDGPFDPSNDVIVYDSLNLTLADAARRVSKKFGLKRVAILTDDPDNISGTSTLYHRFCRSLSSDCDGYFALTEGLLSIFNKGNKPSLVRMGIVEKPSRSESPYPTPYFYYGGTLEVKDGTKALVESFLEAKPDYDLVFAGHGSYGFHLQQLDPAKTRIRFLGQISKEENLAYQQHAALLINPRLYSEKLDAVSVPSKVLEYLSTSAPILTTKSTPILAEFKDDLNVLECSTRDLAPDFRSFFEAHLDENKKLIGLNANHSAAKLFEKYGLPAIGESFVAFLSSLGVR